MNQIFLRSMVGQLGLGRLGLFDEGFLADVLATHPPMAMRIARLKGMGYAQLKKEGGVVS